MQKIYKKKYLADWMSLSLSDLTAMLFNTELTHLGLETSDYLKPSRSKRILMKLNVLLSYFFSADK